MKLNGKTALITGASRGIGAAIAEAFAKEGANIILSARTERVVDVAKQLQAQGYKVESILGDIADDLHVRELAKFCRTKFGGLDILVNNAGVLVSGKLGMMKVEDTRRIFDVNILAAINLTQYAIRLFPRGIGGVIINIASIAGTEGIDGLTSYSASKAAIIGFTKAAAKELASSKIRVNAIAPGFIDTGMARQVSPDWFQKRLEGIRLGRIGQPSDIAHTAVFLASEDAEYITGQILGVDGGMIV